MLCDKLGPPCLGPLELSSWVQLGTNCPDLPDVKSWTDLGTPGHLSHLVISSRSQVEEM